MPSPSDPDDFDYYDEAETAAMREQAAAEYVNKLTADLAYNRETETAAIDEQSLIEHLTKLGEDPSWAEDEVVRGYFRARQDLDLPRTVTEHELHAADALLYSSESEEQYAYPVKALLQEIYSEKISRYISRSLDAQDLEESVYGPIAEAQSQDTALESSAEPLPRSKATSGDEQEFGSAQAPTFRTTYETPMTQRQIKKEARQYRREAKRAANETGPHIPPGAPNGRGIGLS